MIAVFGGKLTAIWVKVVHVAHFDVLDALYLLPVPRNGRIDTLSFLVVT